MRRQRPAPWRANAAIARVLVCVAAFAIAPGVQVARAQSGGTYDLGWHSIASGGVNLSSGGVYALAGTIAQLDAATSAGGTYQLTGGFWAGVGLAQLAGAPDPPRAPAMLSLRGFATNPTVASRLQAAFALASGAPALLELIDVTGRRINVYQVGLLGAGEHTLDLGGGVRVTPGLYWIRLTQAGQVRTTRAVVLR